MPQRSLLSNKLLQNLPYIALAAGLDAICAQATRRVPRRDHLWHRSQLAVAEATAAYDQIAQSVEQPVINIRCGSGRFHGVSPVDTYSCPKTHEKSLITRWFLSETVKWLTFVVRLEQASAAESHNCEVHFARLGLIESNMKDETMTANIVFRLCSVALCFGLIGCERQISYSADVQPILTESCLSCHNRAGEGSVTSGYSVATYEDVLEGTSLGTVVIPGSSESSNLYRVIAMKTAKEIRMPPHHDVSLAEGRGVPLSEEQIKIIKDWIDQGAKNN